MLYTYTKEKWKDENEFFHVTQIFICPTSRVLSLPFFFQDDSYLKQIPKPEEYQPKRK